jgi:hypothetical protein
MHLPRVWLKILLASKGRLADGYRHGEGGYDQKLFERFGVDGPAFVAFVETQQPDYLTAERFFIEHATQYSPQTVASFNAELTSGTFSDPARAKLFRDRVGLDDDTVSRAIPLNDLDDWFGFHEAFKEAAIL